MNQHDMNVEQVKLAREMTEMLKEISATAKQNHLRNTILFQAVVSEIVSFAPDARGRMLQFLEALGRDGDQELHAAVVDATALVPRLP